VRTSECLTIDELIAAARQATGEDDWDHMLWAAGTGATAWRNRDALQRIAFRPRVLAGVAEVDPATTLLAHRLPMPVVLANVGGLSCALNGSDTLAFVPPSFRRTGASSPTILEMSLHGDPNVLAAEIERAAPDGHVAICLALAPTDAEPPQRRVHDVWARVGSVHARTSLPLVGKGIMRADDARRAIDAGCAAVYVSNFGGRASDHCMATIDALGDVVDAVGYDADVIVDGGFLHGTDVLKATAIGADAVAIGRLQCCGAMAGAAGGLERALCLLEDELRVSMALLGTRTIADIGRDHLHFGSPSVAPVLTHRQSWRNDT
jgi:isopentenyl diphosphate isomerase/L-lactate dehydrogenase-like FMN-dependent dehydrogenase